MKMKEEVLEELDLVNDFIDDNGSAGYLFFNLTKDHTSYYIGYAMDSNPYDMIGQLELILQEMKNNVIAASSGAKGSMH